MATPKISLCIPVYNVEPYLSECLDSVISQTFTDFEIIIVNDGSPDNSEKIIKAYQQKDSRIRYFKHEKNLGLPMARKTSLKHARGQYISFVDSDDFVAPSFLEKLYLPTANSQTDVVIGNINFVYPDRHTKIALELKESFTPPWIFHLSATKFGASFSNKLWHKDLFNKPGIDFINISWGEDTILTTRMFYYVKKLAIVDEPLYNYRVDYEKPNSSSPEQKEQKLLTNLSGEFILHKELTDFFTERGMSVEIKKCLADRQKQFLLYGEEIIRLKSTKGQELLNKLISEFHGKTSKYPVYLPALWVKSRLLLIAKKILPIKIFRQLNRLYVKFF